MKNITVGIPFYNSISTLEKTLMSIANQYGVETIQVVVVDDNSIEDCSLCVDRFKDWLDIELIKLDTNIGPGPCRNIVIDRCKTEYITFVDSDDFLLYNMFIHDAVDHLNKQRQSVICNSLMIDERDYSYTKPKNSPLWIHGKVYRVSFLKQHKLLFSERRLMEDFEFNLKLFFHNDQPECNIDIPCYFYSKNPNSLVRQYGDGFMFKEAVTVENDIKIEVINGLDNISVDKIKNYLLSDMSRMYSYANHLAAHAKSSEDMRPFYNSTREYFDKCFNKYMVDWNDEDWHKYINDLELHHTNLKPKYITVLDFFQCLQNKLGENICLKISDSLK
jgi:glycosyltransferase involved in cell wall biosynthesis